MLDYAKAFVIVVALSCGNLCMAESTQRNNLLEKGEFIQVPGPNPILMTGGGWEHFVIETAGIFKDFGTYYLYYHASGPGYQVGVATSKHPLGPFKKYEGNPILEIGAKGSWEDTHVAHAIIIKEGLDKYYMWYCGQGTAGKKLRPDSTDNIWGIGLATATHPLGPWKKYEGNPIISDFGYPSAAVKVGGKYYQYSAYPIGDGVTYAADYSPIRVATAEAPEGPWVVHDKIVLNRGQWGEWDDGGISDAAVVYHSGVFHMFHAGAKEYDPRPRSRESVGYAYSFDGFNFTKYGLNPIATRQANPNAASFSEPRVLIEFPYIYIYHTLRYKEEFGQYVGNPNHEDIGVQVIATQRPFSFDMPVVVAEKLAAGASTKLEDSPPVCLSNIKGVSITAQCKYDKGAKKPIRVHVVSSTDGLVYDTTDLYRFDNDFKLGQTARKTIDLNTNVKFIKIIVENQDMSKTVSQVKITATLKG